MRAFNFALLLVATSILLAAGSACRQTDDVSRLVEAARSGGSLKVRQEACLQLAEAPGDAASAALIGLLGDDQLSYCAAQPLGERKEPRAVDPLLERLDPRTANAEGLANR